MTPRSSRQGQQEQEKACAQAFVNWLSSQRGNSYDLERAENLPELPGRWDFVARERETPRWLALEVKRLIAPDTRRPFGDWSKFCDRLTTVLQRQGVVRGSFAIMVAIPWTFDQGQAGDLIEAMGEALAEAARDMDVAEKVDLGPAIASRFRDWPKSGPVVDHMLWRERRIPSIVCPPVGLLVFKVGDEGCSIRLGASAGQAYSVPLAIQQAVLGIFGSSAGMAAKPNEQLHEARLKGASETILLLDSHIAWGPREVVDVLRSIDRRLLSERYDQKVWK